MEAAHHAKGLRFVVVLVAGLLAVSASASAVAAPAPVSPAQLLDAALAAARSEPAVTWTTHQDDAPYTETVVTDAGRHDGVESRTIHKGLQRGQVSQVLIGPNVYLRADAFGLQVDLGFDPLAAHVEAGRWLVARSSSASGAALYNLLAGAMTVPLVVSHFLTLTGPLSLLPPTTVDGQRVEGLQSTVAEGIGVPATNAVLYVRSVGRPLPVEIVVTADGASARVVFGPWGRPPAAHVPARAVGFQASWLTGHQPSLAIPGAPGYYTFTGPLGGLMQVGRPWGKPCQPIVFDVAPDIPRPVYNQVAAVVGQARAAGLDVTIVNLGNEWYPDLLYPPGQTNSTVEEVHIYAGTGAPPLLADGHPEHINIGWDARPGADGVHEVLTEVQGSLYLGVINGQPVPARRAMVFLVAYTQGIESSVVAGSGLAKGTDLDSFSTRDIAAMQVMSGCHFQPIAQGSVLPPQP